MKFLNALTTFFIVALIALCIYGVATDVKNTAIYVKSAPKSE